MALLLPQVYCTPHLANTHLNNGGIGLSARHIQSSWPARSAAATSPWSCRASRQIAQNHSLGDSHLTPFTQNRANFERTHTHTQRVTDPFHYNTRRHPPTQTRKNAYKHSLIQFTLAACQNRGHSHLWWMSAKQTWADEEMRGALSLFLSLSPSVLPFVCAPDSPRVCLSQCFSLSRRCLQLISLINLF